MSKTVMKIDEIECSNRDLTETINKYHALDYLVEVSVKNIIVDYFGNRPQTYGLSIFRVIDEQEEAANE